MDFGKFRMNKTPGLRLERLYMEARLLDMKLRTPRAFLYINRSTFRPKAEKSPTLSSLSRTHHAINKQFYWVHVITVLFQLGEVPFTIF